MIGENQQSTALEPLKAANIVTQQAKPSHQFDQAAECQPYDVTREHDPQPALPDE
jgi:hypothetical protein